MSPRSAALLSSLVLLLSSPAAFATSISLRSGNVPVGNPEPAITFLVEPSGQCAQPFAAAFTPADFAAADAGPAAWSAGQNGAWGALTCDPNAGWISTAMGWPSRSALYSVPFTIDLPDPCCIQSATLNLCFMADDNTGDAIFGGPNPLGVYVNGIGTGGPSANYATPTAFAVDITAMVKCGVNHLYIYNRDAGCQVAGIDFSARIDYTECVTPSPSTTWGQVRALYRN